MRRAAASARAELQQAFAPAKCKRCDGATTTVCERCKGRGKVGGGVVGSAKPLETCGACGGRGKLRCARCKGAGLENAWLWKKGNEDKPVIF